MFTSFSCHSPHIKQTGKCLYHLVNLWYSCCLILLYNILYLSSSNLFLVSNRLPMPAEPLSEWWHLQYCLRSLCELHLSLSNHTYWRKLWTGWVQLMTYWTNLLQILIFIKYLSSSNTYLHVLFRDDNDFFLQIIIFFTDCMAHNFHNFTWNFQQHK